MIDTTTAYLKLPLPHEDNLLTDDVTRLREAFTGLDDHAASVDAGLEEAAKTAEWDKVSGKPTAYPPVDHGHPAQTTVSGNAGSATKLATARTLQTNLATTTAAKFDGSADASLGVTGILPVANGGTGNATGKAASATTASSCTGNSATATKLAAARTISLTGAVTGSASFDGSKNVSIATTLVADAGMETVLLTTSGTFMPKKTGVYSVILVGGGKNGNKGTASDSGGSGGKGGDSGTLKQVYLNLMEGVGVPYIIGAANGTTSMAGHSTASDITKYPQTTGAGGAGGGRNYKSTSGSGYIIFSSDGGGVGGNSYGSHGGGGGGGGGFIAGNIKATDGYKESFVVAEPGKGGLGYGGGGGGGGGTVSNIYGANGGSGGAGAPGCILIQG